MFQGTHLYESKASCHFLELKFYYFREFACMFEEADKNQDGRIDFEEFQAMMLPGS